MAISMIVEVVVERGLMAGPIGPLWSRNEKGPPEGDPLNQWIQASGLEAHVAHATALRHGRRILLRDFANHRFGGDEKAGD